MQLVLEQQVVGSSDQCNTLWGTVEWEGDRDGTDGASGLVCGPESGPVATVETGAVVKRDRSDPRQARRIDLWCAVRERWIHASSSHAVVPRRPSAGKSIAMGEPSHIAPRRPIRKPGRTRDAPSPAGSPPSLYFSRLSRVNWRWSGRRHKLRDGSNWNSQIKTPCESLRKASTAVCLFKPEGGLRRNYAGIYAPGTGCGGHNV